MCTEYINKCLLCNSDKNNIRHQNVRGYDIVKCLECGFVYCNNQPSGDDLEQYYSEKHGLVDKAITTNVQDDAENYKDTKLFLKLIGKYTPKCKKICEIGCSYGYLLWGLQKAGYAVKGYELSKTTAKVGREKLGLDISAGDFCQDGSSIFDVFILRHVLEHLRDPQALMEHISQQIKDDGTVVLVTPNIKSLSAILFGRTWNWMDPPLHLFYFSKKTMLRMLNDCGFEIVKTFTKKGDSLNFYHHYLRWFVQEICSKNKNSEIGTGLVGNQTGTTKISKKILISFCKCLHVLTYPIWWLVWKCGYGEELWVVAKKKTNNNLLKRCL